MSRRRLWMPPSCGDLIPWFATIPFGENQAVISFQESIREPYQCRTSDRTYISMQQCIYEEFLTLSRDFCSFPCIPIQLKGFRYINENNTLQDCRTLEEEVCTGGPKTWKDLEHADLHCDKPCQITEYIGRLTYLYQGKNKKSPKTIQIKLRPYRRRKMMIEYLVYDWNDMIGSFGGSAGLFLGFSFFGVISDIIDLIIEYCS